MFRGCNFYLIRSNDTEGRNLINKKYFFLSKET